MRIDPKALNRAKERLRQLTSRRWGVSMERRIEEINRFTVGWTAYFALADTPSAVRGARQMAQPATAAGSMEGMEARAHQAAQRCRALGIPERDARKWAYSRKGYWRISGSPILARALPNAYWADLGLQGFTEPYRRFRDAKRTAGCGPARPVVWGAPG